MTNTVVVPLQNAYKTTLTSSIDNSTTTIVVDAAPGFSVPAGKKIPAVIDPKNSFREVVLITAIAGSSLTVERGEADYDGGPSTANTHSAGASFVITNHFGIFDDFADAIDSKLDNDGGNADATAFDLQVGNFRVRKDANDMKFTDDNQSEITLSTLAAGGGADEKVKGSSDDTTAQYLEDKLTVTSGAGATVTKTTTSPGGNEKVNIDVALNTSTIGTTIHETYTPAFLTGGNAPETTIAIWDSVADGAFQITIDGVARSIGSLDFNSPAVTSMAEVAAVIQAGIRVVTGSLETCTWSGTEFVISSVNTTASSAITVLTAGAGGTDISGVAGGSQYMDCDVGSTAAVTAAVLDPTADVGLAPLLNAAGNVDTDLLREVIDKDGYAAKGDIIAATAVNTPGILTVGSDDQVLTADSGETTGLKWATSGTGKVYCDGATVNVTNTSTETTIYSFTLPGNSLSTNNALAGRIYLIDIGNSSGSTRTLTYRLKYGATTLATITHDSTNGTNKDGYLDFEIFANAATNAQRAHLVYRASNKSVVILIDTFGLQGTGTGAEDSTGDLTVNITCQPEVAHAGLEIQARGIRAQLIK